MEGRLNLTEQDQEYMTYAFPLSLRVVCRCRTLSMSSKVGFQDQECILKLHDASDTIDTQDYTYPYNRFSDSIGKFADFQKGHGCYVAKGKDQRHDAVWR
jgi:hypothetical protein